MENKVCCKANLQKKQTVVFKVIIVFMILLTVLIIIWFVPSRKKDGKYIHHYNNNYKIYDVNYELDSVETEYSTRYYNLCGVCIARSVNYDSPENILYISDYFWGHPEILVPVSIWAVAFIAFITLLLMRSTSKKCTLELNQDGIFGLKKKLFSKASINQPFEQIDSVYLKNGIIDKILGGQTIVISTASSRIGFLCIANAQEFVDKTLEELKKYKESVASNKEKAPASSDDNAMDAILKLKNLLDQGLITPEEFEEKRKLFINKI
jgi:hypothetical protein